MADNAGLAYLQARLQARYGDRPSPDDWRVAEASADLSHYLEALRRTPLKRWVSEVNQDMEPEAIERQLRLSWREAVDEVAGWSPPQWQSAVQWLRWVPDLPALDHLLRGRKVAPWMRSDPVMRELAFEDPARRREALAGQPLAPLLPAEEDTGAPRVVDAWIREWHRRLPRHAGGDRELLESMVELVLRHVEAMRASEDPHGRALRNQLAGRLARNFRRGAGTVVALFSYLALEGLELERIRAGVMSRRLLPERVEGRSWA